MSYYANTINDILVSHVKLSLTQFNTRNSLGSEVSGMVIPEVECHVITFDNITDNH